MTRNKIIVSTWLVMIATPGFTQHPDFLYSRKIANLSQEGWHSITLPNNIFTHLNNNFHDIRLYSITHTDTIEIPYLLKVKEDQVLQETIDLPLVNTSKKNGVLFFTVDTKGNTVNNLDLNFTQQNFNAYVKMEGSNDQHEWYELVNNQRILSINSETIQYATTQIHFPITNYRYLRVSVKSDVVLTLTHASFKNRTIKPGVINHFKPKWTARQDAKYKQTIIDITLDDITPITQIEIQSSNDLDYYRSFTLDYASDSSKTPKGWAVFYTNLHQGYLTSLDNNNFNFHFQLAKKLRLTIDNQDNTPLSIKEITVSAPEVALLTKLKPIDTYLFYGNTYLENPSYDLVRFEEKIPDSLIGATLDEEVALTKQTEATKPLITSKHWLWAIMAITIAVMGFFTLRMMRSR